MWATGFWIDGFLPLWPEFLDRSVIPFEVSLVVTPAITFRKGTLVSYFRQVTYWRWTKVK